MIVEFSLLLFTVFTFGTLFELVVTRGVCFVYVIGYPMSLVIVLAILKVKRFGTGVAIFLPYAILGFFIEYMMEVVTNPALIAPWAVLIWSLSGPLAGLSADISLRLLPPLGSRSRAALAGLISISTYFLSTLLVLAFLYIDPTPGLTHYTQGIFLTLPWLLSMGLLGGYTASLVSEKTLNDQRKLVSEICAKELKANETLDGA